MENLNKYVNSANERKYQRNNVKSHEWIFLFRLILIESKRHVYLFLHEQSSAIDLGETWKYKSTFFIPGLLDTVNLKDVIMQPFLDGLLLLVLTLRRGWWNYFWDCLIKFFQLNAGMLILNYRMILTLFPFQETNFFLFFVIFGHSGFLSFWSHAINSQHILIILNQIKDVFVANCLKVNF